MTIVKFPQGAEQLATMFVFCPANAKTQKRAKGFFTGFYVPLNSKNFYAQKRTCLSTNFTTVALEDSEDTVWRLKDIPHFI